MGALANAKDNAVSENVKPTPKQDEPKFFRENWKKVMASTEQSKYKLIRVRDKVASITNGKILLRTPVPEDDGFYTLGSYNQMLPNQDHQWMSYPDIDQSRPDFDKLKPTCQIPREVLGQMGQFCEAVRQRKGLVMMDVNGMSMVQDGNLAYNYPFNIKNEEIFNPNHLKLALTEMLRYDFVYVAKERGSLYVEDTYPLILGHDWGRCALIMPLVGSGGYYY